MPSGCPWRLRLSRELDIGSGETVGDPSPELFFARARSFQSLQEIVELDESSRGETEGASGGADDADELVVLGSRDVMQSLMRALDEHLAALLDHRTKNR